MADPTIPTPPADDPQRRRVIVVSVASVIALLIASAVVGWVIGSSGPSTPVAHDTPSPSVSATSPSPTPSATPSASATPTGSATVPGGGLPNLAGIPFTDAFAQLRALKLGVNVVFLGEGDDQTVDHTDPAAGTVVKGGSTVKLFVKGSAPLVTVPDLTGLSCASGTGTAGNTLFEKGLKIAYADGVRDGIVISQTPDATSTTTHWNDTVTVTCGTASPTDQPSAAAG